MGASCRSARALCRFGVSGFLILTFLAFASERSWADSTHDGSLGNSVGYLLDNVSPPGTRPGVVVAATSRQNPDYFYHWIRDAGLVMDIVVSLYRGATSQEKPYYRRLLNDYASFSRENQQANALTGLGEPKFYVDGRPYGEPWGRPQNDGPAIRAVTLTRYAHTLLAEGNERWVRERLYDGKIPTHSVIKADLEFVSHHWHEASFDLWEEVKGHHFYTRMVQRRSLLDGARLARLLGDGAAADWYEGQAREISRALLTHWDGSRGIFVATLGRETGADYKNSDLDTAVILGVLHGYADDGFLAPTDERVLSTFQKLRSAFHNLYPINHQGFPADAIGRYPEDHYDGYSTGGLGNPWVLITVGFGEFLYRAAKGFQAQGRIEITSTNLDFFRSLDGNLKVSTLYASDPRFTQIIEQMLTLGDDFLRRARVHGFADGRFAEQIHRDSGYMKGADNLTWSYASWVTAVVHRAQIQPYRTESCRALLAQGQ